MSQEDTRACDVCGLRLRGSDPFTDYCPGSGKREPPPARPFEDATTVRLRAIIAHREHEQVRAPQTLIDHCIGCDAFVINPASPNCPSCERELHPVSFRALHGRPFWASGDAESRLSATPAGVESRDQRHRWIDEFGPCDCDLRWRQWDPNTGRCGFCGRRYEATRG